MKTSQQIYFGQQPLTDKKSKIIEGFKDIDGDLFYEIENYRQMPPFFMTLTSHTNHWMFISSTGGLTAGRVNSEKALFPYYTDDRITENLNNTGPKTILLISKNDKTYLWEPFHQETESVYEIRSVLSKNVYGNTLIFEDINETLGVSFSYRWMNSSQFGWIRKSTLKNLNDHDIQIDIIDGMQNIIPAGTSSKIQNTFGNLLNAYKKSEIDSETGLGIFALSATLTDLAEPSESLKANVAWHKGLKADKHLLSANQFDNFRRGNQISNEWELKGERGGYFIHSSFTLSKLEIKQWYFAADVDLDHSQINNLKNLLRKNSDEIITSVEEDVTKGQDALDAIIAQNDGKQNTSNKMNCVHHQANVLFNIMRGGYFFNSYNISTEDLVDFINITNKEIGEKYREAILSLGEEKSYDDLISFILDQKDDHLLRIWYEYLPLTFSRRHGDPSRPWNVFSIETEKKDGTAKLDYQGNWRDIFQNWEALCYSYPVYIKHIIGKFLNATTKDGYNPYRITKNGIDWEIPEPGNPWANIGYWSDHQIIYLLKLLEMYGLFYGDKINEELDSQNYSFANIPYEIKSFQEILEDPHQTINFNNAKNEEIEKLTEEKGSEGKLLHDSEGSLFLATMTEKLFILLLAKLGNYIPEGGIWMNTQRPEWNDANNALVGKGISVVTLAYLRRYISFLIDMYKSASHKNFYFHSDTAQWLNSISSVFSGYEKNLDNAHSAEDIFIIVESLGVASENYRSRLYLDGPKNNQTKVTRSQLVTFLESTLNCVDDTLKKNRRDDDLYHSYNTLQVRDKGVYIDNLYEMLEGQVAILSSGMLSAEEADRLFASLRNSSMYREDQNSYMLYPNRKLPGFLNKNNIDEKKVQSLRLLKKLSENNNDDLVSKDDSGTYHFNGSFHNVKQVQEVLDQLSKNDAYSHLIDKEGKEIEKLFETTFNHQSFTGRSGTFFAFEGLGSIYWHMVSKLLLAAQENLFEAIESGVDDKIITSLKNHYYSIRNGIGYNKSAENYGAFPFDPYSHTPWDKGAKQPGMTGQVKEEVITRLAEMGIRIKGGQLEFNGTLLDESEFLKKECNWPLIDVPLSAGSLAGTICQTPFYISKGDKESITVVYKDKKQIFSGSILPEDISEEIFKRSGIISYIGVEIL